MNERKMDRIKFLLYQMMEELSEEEKISLMRELTLEFYSEVMAKQVIHKHRQHVVRISRMA